MKVWRLLIPVLVVGLGACQGSGPSSENVVARAADFELPAEAVADILGPQSQLPNQPQVVEALANLWIDYFLLARTAAQDTTLSNLEVGPLVKRQAEQEMVLRLRDEVIQVDTSITDAELQTLYETELPGGKVRARHILLQFPAGATQAQADSVRALADSIRARLVAGEDFAEMAREYSQDSATAEKGGELGTFGRGEMVLPFEQAAFTLEPGAISEVVETNYGLHLIQVEERVVPSLDENRDQFKAQIQQRRVQAAESTYVANLMDSSAVEIQDGSIEALKQVASDPEMQLSGRAADRALVRYEGGALTLGEFREWLLTSAPNIGSQIQAAPDDQINTLLENLTRSELLVERARENGIEVPVARLDSISSSMREGVQNIARELGFFDLPHTRGAALDTAADQAVKEILVQVVQQNAQVYPLGTVSFALRNQYGSRIYPTGAENAVEMITQRRAQAAPPAPAPGAAIPPVDTTTPTDTGGGGN